MSFSTISNKIEYTLDGATSVFAYDFKIFADTEMTAILSTIATGAILQTLVLNTDFTVSGAGDASGGNVTLTGDLHDDTIKLTLLRVLPQTQENDWIDNEPTPATTWAEVADRAIMISQQLQEEVDRSVKVNVGASATPVLPAPVDGNVVVWDGTDGTMENQPYDTASLDASAAAAAASASAASGSASAASSSETNAGTSETNAAASESAAAASAALLGDATLSAEVIVDNTLLKGDGGVRGVQDSGITVDDSDNITNVTSIEVDGAAPSPPVANTLYTDNIIRGWINLDGTGTIAINDSFNVSGIVDDGTGTYTITWDLDFANANYAIAAFGADDTDDIHVTNVAIANYTAGSVQVRGVNSANNVEDASIISIIAIGAQ